jgi:subtilisin family serine protease
MKRRWNILLGAGILLLLIDSDVSAGEKTTRRLQSVMSRVRENAGIYAWVYFTDKGSHEAMRHSIPLTIVSERSIARRKKVRSPQDVVDYSDLPVEQLYITEVGLRVGRVRQRSKWFNGVSVVATKAQLSSLERLPCVREVDLLARFGKNQTEREEVPDGTQQSAPRKENGTHALDYGGSFGQVNQINVPAVHDLGNHAEGVIVGVLDNGFRLLSHEAYGSMLIIAQYDFVDHKESVVPNNPSMSFGAHGVNTLSTIGGYMPGQLIGPAFGASFILARTENDSSETPIEEDNWVAAIEWADSIGVDVTSTSLG